MSVSTIKQGAVNGANGIFKSEDGTLIQWGVYESAAVTATAVGSLYIANLQCNITFQTMFIGNVPSVAITQQGGYGAVFTSSVYRDKIASVDLVRPTSGTIVPKLLWLAVGRWK